MTRPMDDAPPHLVAFLDQHGVEYEFIAPGVPTPTVPLAAAAIGAPEEQILKTLLFTGDDGGHVIAIANGTRRVDRALLAAASGMKKPRVATPESVVEVTGFTAGGVAPVGFTTGVAVIVDPGVVALQAAFGGGGREHLLLRLDPADIVRLNDALVAPIVSEG